MFANSEYQISVIGNPGLKQNLEESGFRTIGFANLSEAKDYEEKHPLESDLIIFADGICRTEIGGDVLRKIGDSPETTLRMLIDSAVKEQDFQKDLALSMLDHHEGIYHKILSRFIAEYENLDTVLLDLLAHQDLNKIREYVHKLRGISLNLGSDKYYRICKNLEEKIAAGKALPEDIRFFIRYHHRLIAYSKEQENYGI